MNFKLIQMMYSTHKNFEEQNVIYSKKIISLMKTLLESGNLNFNINRKYSKINDFYSLISENKKLYQTDFFLKNLKEINSNLYNKTTLLNNNNKSEKILENYLTNYTKNITNEIENSIKGIKKTIIEINEEIKKIGIHPYLYEDFHSLINQINFFINNKIEKNINYQINEGENIYINRIKEKIKKIMNLNKINNIENLIEENSIFNYIFTTNEKEFLLSNLTDIIKYIKNNLTSSLDSPTDIFRKNLPNLNFTEISKLLSEVNNNLSIIIKENITEYNIIEEYFTQIDKIDQFVNNIITNYIKNYTNILFNQSYYSYELINNITINTQKINYNLGNKIKEYLNEIKNDKISNLSELNNTYFEKNMLDFYNITDQNNKFYLNDNFIKCYYNYEVNSFNSDKTYQNTFILYNCSSFDIDFMSSIDEIITNWAKKIIDQNFDLTYQYFQEVKSFLDNCYKECKEYTNIIDFFIDCDLDYYLNNGFIKYIKTMSINSYKIVNNLLSENFLKKVKEYYNSFENEFNKVSKLNQNNNYSYLKNLNIKINDNFNQIKEFIALKTIPNLDNYGKYKKSKFLSDFHKFTDKKEGTVSNKNYDIKIEYFFISKKYKAPSSLNYYKIDTQSTIIIDHLEDKKDEIIQKYSQIIEKINNYYNKYNQDLVSILEGKQDDNNYDINLYFILEKYSSEMLNILDNYTNYEFINKIINEYQNNLTNIFLIDKFEYLNESLYNLKQIYNNSPYLINNEEIKIKIDENIEQIRYIKDIKELS